MRSASPCPLPLPPRRARHSAAAGPPAAAGPKQTLSLIGFILGLVGFVFCSGPGLLGVGRGRGDHRQPQGQGSEPGAPTWMHTIGLIAGIVGIVIGVISSLVFLAQRRLIPLIALGTSGITTY